MLQRLSGREHAVITGFAVLYPGGTTAHVEAVDTRVRFRPLAPDEIRAYVATGEPFGKAGAYAIQGIGAFLAESKPSEPWAPWPNSRSRPEGGSRVCMRRQETSPSRIGTDRSPGTGTAATRDRSWRKKCTASASDGKRP